MPLGNSHHVLGVLEFEPGLIGLIDERRCGRYVLNHFWSLDLLVLGNLLESFGIFPKQFGLELERFNGLL